MLALDLLGPVVLRRDGAVLPLAVKKTQALLVLLAATGRTPRARVAALLWPALDEPTGRRNLRRELARLREAGAADMVLSVGDFLHLAPDIDCDLWRLRAAGDGPASLPGWRGTLADGLLLGDAPPFDDWLQAERGRWQGVRQRARQAQLLLHEAQGESALALQLVQALLDDDPLQERHHRDAMRLLSASGQREAALAQYERCRSLLQQELGLRPMAETEALAAAVRTAGAAAVPSLLASPAKTSTAATATAAPAAHSGWSPVQLPSRLPLVGRHDTVPALEAAWCAGQAVVLEGEGGVGKSRLALDFAAAHGPCALARCRPGDSELPYAAFARALRALAGPTPAVQGLPAWAQHELARLLPELGAPPPPLQSGEERQRFFEACAMGWRWFTDDSFDVVLLDDWHLADAASDTLLAFVLQRRREQGPSAARAWLLMRPVADRAAHQARCAGLQALPLTLLPLSPADVLDLVRRLSGAAHPAHFAEHLAAVTAGNAFFIAETLRHWAEQRWLWHDEQGNWRTPFDDNTADYAELTVPQRVHEAVLARVQRLSAAAGRLLQAAALAVEPFTPQQLAPACALSELDTVLAFEEATQALLLHEHPAGGYAFAHDLVQQALEAALAPDRRRLVHRRLALGAEAALAEPTLTALHWEAAGEPARAVAHRMAAAESAARLFSHDVALQQWQAALDGGPTPAQRVRVLTQRWPVQRAMGDKAALLLAVCDLDAVAEQLGGAPSTQALAADAAIDAASLCTVLNRSAEALVRCQAVLSVLSVLAVDDSLRRARALEVRATALMLQGRLAEGQASAEAAMALDALDPAQTARLLDALTYRHFLAGQPEAALPLARRALALWQALHMPRWVARLHCFVGVLLQVSGDSDAAVESLERSRTLSAASHLVEQGREAIANLIHIAIHRGQPDRVLALADEGCAAAPGFVRRHRHLAFLLAYHVAYLQRGELGLALQHADRVLAFVQPDDEPALRTDAASVLLALFTALRDEARAQALQALLHGPAAQEVGYYAIKLAFARAGFELAAGDLPAAQASVASVGAREGLQQPEDRALHDLRSAQIALQQADAASAFKRVAAWPGEAPTVELWAQLQTVQLLAVQACGLLTLQHLQSADLALHSGRLPAFDAWVLMRQSAAAAACLNDPSAATRAAAAANALQSLAQSLDGYPQERAHWLATLALQESPT